MSSSDLDTKSHSSEEIPLRHDAPARIKICLACSHGGHLTEMLALQEAFEGHDSFYFCYDADTTRRLPNAYLVPNMARNPIEFLKNLWRVYQIFKKERPDMVVSTGAEIAIPVVLIAKLFGLPTVYVECGAQVTHPSVTGRLMYWLAETFYVQWPELLSVYGPRAVFRGSLIDEDAPIPGDRCVEKRMKVSMVQPSQTEAFSSDQPPMGLAYVASVLEQHGCDVRVVDANVEKLSPDQVVRLLRQQQPDLVCFSVTTPLFPSTLAIAKQLKALAKPPVLVAGGPHATVLPDELLNEGLFDYVVRGEGEKTIGELVENLLDGRGGEGIEGLSWYQDSAVVHNPNRALSMDFNTFAYPDWSLFPLKKYGSLARRNDLSLPITTSRGCPFVCSFCYKGVYGRKLRMRTPEEVVDEWEFLINRYALREIAVLDDVFSFDLSRAMAICELLIARGLDRVPWSTTNGIRVDNVTPELFQAMKRAGCYRVYFGIESGVQAIIDSLHKKITLEQVGFAVAEAKKAGLEVGGYFMLGNVGETVADMEKTIEYALDLGLDYAQFSIATPYPGTEMSEHVSKNGQLHINSWEDLATYGTGVFSAGEVTPDLVGRQFRRAIRKFYFRPRYALKQLRELFTWTGFRHRTLASWLLIKLAVLGGRRQVSVVRPKQRKADA